MIGAKEPRLGGPGGYNEEGLSVQETAAVFANFEFLANQEMDMDEIDDLDAKQTHHASGKSCGLKITCWSLNVITVILPNLLFVVEADAQKIDKKSVICQKTISIILFVYNYAKPI